LREKGVISAEDLSTLTTPPASAQVASAWVASTTPAVLAVAQAATTSREKEPAAPTVVSAVAPLRVLPVDLPVKDGLIPAFKK